jgi:hypothetical protein
MMKFFRITCCFFVLLLSLVVFSFVPRSQASAASGLVTKGDVEAILHAGSSGGGIMFHEHPVPGFEDFPRAAITPLSFHSGTHYCVDDWHVVRITFANFVDNVDFFTKEQAIADLEATTITLTLDGVTLPAIRTPIIMLNAGFWKQRFDLPGPGFAFQTGSILSPAALSVGDHTAGLVATDPVFGTFQDSSTFTVDSSGTGACLQG